MSKEKMKADQLLKLKAFVLDSVRDYVSICDEEFDLIYCNESGFRLTGYPGDAPASLETLYGEGAKAFLNEIRAVAEKDGKWSGETRIRHADGRLVDVRHNLHPVRDEEGTLIGYCNTMSDLTDQKSKEKRLLLQSSILRSMSDCVMATDERVDVIYANPAIYQVTGYSEEDLGTICPETVHDLEAAAIIRKKCEGILNGSEERWAGETTLQCKSGEQKEIFEQLFPIRDEKGKVSWVGVIIRDITESKRLERESLQIKERLQVALESSRSGVWEYDLLADVVTFDDNFAAICGIPKTTPRTVSAERFFEGIRVRMGEEEGNRCIAKMRSRKPGFNNMENLTLTLPEEEIRHISSYSRYVTADKGNAIRIVGLVMDVTERIAMEEQALRAKEMAEEASKAKTQFLSNMSHEIRTPMNALIGMTQIARRSSNPEKIRSCLDKIESSSSHLLGIINDVLDLSKIESGKLMLNKERISLKKNLDFVMSMITSRATEQNISVELQLKYLENDEVITDSLRLNQVLMNLLTNAVKFSHAGGKVTLVVEEISIRENHSLFMFEVIDEGIGMSRKEMKRLFKPFEQADGSIARRFGGTGLGLAISKNIVSLMGGEIGATSEKGKGSTFSFTIEAETIKGQEITQGQSAEMYNSLGQATGAFPEVDFSNLRAMVVDDIEINRLIISELLSDTGIKIDEAEDGRAAVNMFQSSEPGYYDLILMDMQMPVMDGCSAAKIIRTCGRPDAQTVAIIAMTANVFKEDVEMALNSGMDGHIGKPIDLVSAIETIHRIVIGHE